MIYQGKQKYLLFIGYKTQFFIHEKNIFDRVQTPSDILYTDKLCIQTSLHGFPGLSKNNVENICIQESYNDLIKDYTEKGFIILATDASINLETSESGIAVIDCQSDIIYSYKIKEKLSSKSAELLAIDRAIDVSIQEGYSSIVIFTDSKTSCLVLMNQPDDDFLVASIINKIESSCCILECHIVWMPGHTGIEINETADREAKLALNEGLEIDPPLTPMEALNQITECIKKDLESLYIETSLTKGKFFFHSE